MSDLIISADRLIDGSGGPTRLRPELHIRGKQILAVTPSRHEGATVQHRGFPGCTILPGLVDTHVHLVFSADATNEAIVAQVCRESEVELFNRAAANASRALYAGITTLRDCGGKGNVTQRLRDAIRRGEVDGPEILSCGMPITTRTGHCYWLGLTADTAVEAVHAARRMLEEGADFLKVMATGGNMTPSSDPMRPQYDSDTLKRLADVGRDAGKHTAAHVLSRAGLPGAVAAKVRTIEHCDWRVTENQYEFEPELARQMVDHEQYVGLTMGALARRAVVPAAGADQSAVAQRLNARFECERRMIDAGVQYTLHSDAGVRLTPVEHFALGLRAAQIELRLTPSDIIQAATHTAATALGLTDRGALMPGKQADLLVVEGNPLTDLSSLGRIQAVMKAGRWINLPK